MASSADETIRMRDAALEARDTFRAISDIMSDQLATSRASADQMTKLRDSLKGMSSIEDQLLEVQRQKQEYIEDQVKQGKILNNDLLKRFNLTEDLLKKEKERKDTQEQIKDMQSEFKDSLLGSLGTLGDMVKAGSAFGAGMILVKKASEMVTSAFDSTVGLAKDLYTQTGATAAESARLGAQTMGAMVSMEGLLYGGEALAKAAQDASEYYGSTAVITTEMQKNITKLSAMGVEGAAQMNSIFESASGNAGELTGEIQAIAQDAGVNANAVLKDMSSNMTAMVGKSKEELKYLAKKTIELHKQGMSMTLIEDMSANMLDIESSLKAQMKARAFGMSEMLGDTEKMRNAAMEIQFGDRAKGAELMAEAMKEAGLSSEKLGNMGTKQVEILAQGYGMTSQQLTEMVTKEEELAKIKKEYGVATTAEAIAIQEQTAANKALFATIGSGALAALPALINLAGQYATINAIKSTGGGAAAALPSAGGAAEKVGGAAKGGGGGIGKTISGLGKGVGGAMKGIAGGFAAFANPATILGVAVITAGLIGVGFALKVAAPGIKAIGEAISTVVGSLGDFIVKIAQIASPEVGLGLMSLALGFGSLSFALASFAIAGIAATPAMVAVGVFTAAMSALGAVGDSGAGGGGGNEKDLLLEEIKGLRSDIQSQPIVIKVNDKMVTEMNRANSRMESVRRQHR